MSYDFVLTENDEGIMAGGYIINDRLLVSSMAGGRNEKKYDEYEDEDEDEDIKNKLPKYSIPAGLFYIDIPHSESSVKMMYNNATELSDNIYDALYDNILISNSEIKNNTKNTKNIKNTKKRKNDSNKKSKQTKKQKK